MDSTARCRRRRGARGERDDGGAAALEFALVVPFLVLILFGIISFGFMLSFRQALSQSAAEGARAAAVQVDPARRSADATAAVDEALAAVGVTCNGGALYKGATRAGTCSIGPAAPCASGTGDCVTVGLVYDYRAHPAVPSMPLVEELMPQQLSYSATVRVS